MSFQQTSKPAKIIDMTSIAMARRKPPALKLPLQQIHLSFQQMEELRAEAKAKYPDRNVEEALNLYIRYNDVRKAMFDMDGLRCLRGEDIYYHFEIPRWCKETEQEVSRWTRVEESHVTRPQGFKYPFYPDPNSWIEAQEVQKMMVHKSERGWARSARDPHHISKFPNEIMANILRFIVQVPRNGSNRMLRPILHDERSSGNLELLRNGTPDSRPSYNVVNGHVKSHNSMFQDEFLPPVIVKKQNYWPGDYFVIRKIRNVSIDARILQHSFFNAVGTDLLYRKNGFYFKCLFGAECHSYSSMTRKKECEMVHSKELKPLLGRRFSTPDLQRDWEAEVPNIIYHLIDQITHRVDLARHAEPKSDPSLMSWAEHDPFIYFVWLMWPQKTALLRKLAFEGMVKFHDHCDSSCGQRYRLFEPCSSGCFVDNLRIYFRLIKAFCPELTHLTLYVWADLSSLSARMHNSQDPNLRTTEQVLGPFLAREVRGLPKLECLEVVSLSGEDMSFADETVEWVKNNANRPTGIFDETASTSRSAKKAKKSGPQYGKYMGPDCGFCKGRHNYAKCPVVCRFCGIQDHPKDKCKKWLRARRNEE